jgi:GTP cyclohydrolase II
MIGLLVKAACVDHRLPANPPNERYLDTKRDRSGHLL